MNTQNICAQLSTLGCSIHSEVGPAPSDIDIYVPPAILTKVVELVKAAGFIQTGHAKGQHVFRRFEDGQLYILDLLSTFDAYTSHAPLELSAAGHAAIGASPTLHRSFKYLCLRQTAKFAYIKENLPELVRFLSTSANFISISPALANAAYLNAEQLVAAVPVPSFWQRLQSYWARVGKGAAIAFVGPDGSGKTFLIDKFGGIGPTKIVYMGDWFFVFQRLYNLLLKIPSPCNRIVYAFYPIENYARLAKVLFLRLTGKIVLIDRFPGTNRNVLHKGALGRINAITFAIFPKPDLIVLLDAPPEVVFARKQELSIAEIDQIQQELRKILAPTRHLVLDTQQLDASLNMLLSRTMAITGADQ